MDHLPALGLEYPYHVEASFGAALGIVRDLYLRDDERVEDACRNYLNGIRKGVVPVPVGAVDLVGLYRQRRIALHHLVVGVDRHGVAAGLYGKAGMSVISYLHTAPPKMLKLKNLQMRIRAPAILRTCVIRMWNGSPCLCWCSQCAALQSSERFRMLPDRTARLCTRAQRL